MKYLGINILRDGYNQYKENFKMLLKDTKDFNKSTPKTVFLRHKTVKITALNKFMINSIKTFLQAF